MTFITRKAGSAFFSLIQSSVVQKWAALTISGVSTFVSEDSFCLKRPFGDFRIAWTLNKQVL